MTYQEILKMVEQAFLESSETWASLGRKTGYCGTNYHKWFSGSSGPRAPAFIDTAQALGIEIIAVPADQAPVLRQLSSLMHEDPELITIIEHELNFLTAIPDSLTANPDSLTVNSNIDPFINDKQVNHNSSEGIE